jgi:hypothetical protein
MRSRLALVVALIACSSPVMAETSVQFGVGTSSLQFDFLYSDYGADRRVVEREVAVLGEPDLLVALHLCRVADVELDVVVGWRRSGLSWDAITRRCHRDATIYYIDVPADVSGPPYGRAHGHWKKHPRGDLKLQDAEIREFVLVQSLATHCGVPAADIVQRRVRGENAKAIATHRPARRGEDTAPPAAASKAPGKGHGKSGKHK